MKLDPSQPSAPTIETQVPASTREVPTLTAIQWLVCAVAGLGFAFDLYESLMTALIVGPVVSTLGSLKPGTSEFNLWVGLFFFLPAVAGGCSVC